MSKNTAIYLKSVTHVVLRKCNICSAIYHITIGTLISYMSVYSRIINSFSSLAANIPTFIKYNNYLERIRDILKQEHKQNVKRDKTGSIVLKNVSFTYNKKEGKVIDLLNMSINKGENIFIYGDNGSGKTTLANIICGYEKIDEGFIKKSDKNKISTLIEPYKFIPGNVKDHKPKSATQQKYKEMLRKYSLIEFYNESIFNLSYGQKKKVYLIMALVNQNNKVCILDEPLKGIDNKSKDMIFNDIINFTKEKTLLYISHDFKQKIYFDRVIKIEKGKGHEIKNLELSSS